MGQDTGLEGHDPAAFGEGGTNLFRYVERFGHRSGQVSRLAAALAPAAHASVNALGRSAPRASSASRTPSNASPAPVGSASVIWGADALIVSPPEMATAPCEPRFTTTTSNR